MDYLPTSIGLLPRRQVVLPRVQSIRSVPPGSERVSFNGPGILLFSAVSGKIESRGRNWGVKDAGLFLFGPEDRCTVFGVAESSKPGASVTGIETEPHTAHPHFFQNIASPELREYYDTDDVPAYWEQLLQKAVSIFPQADPMYADIFDIIVFELINHIFYEKKRKKKKDETREKPGKYSQIILDIQRRIQKNPAEEIDYEKAAEEYGLSFTTFRRYWKNMVNTPPNEYLHKTRMDYARRLLVTTEKSVRDIAEESGYHDQLYFSRRFRHYHGVSPSRFREETT